MKKRIFIPDCIRREPRNIIHIRSLKNTTFSLTTSFQTLHHALHQRKSTRDKHQKQSEHQRKTHTPRLRHRHRHHPKMMLYLKRALVKILSSTTHTPHLRRRHRLWMMLYLKRALVKTLSSTTHTQDIYASSTPGTPRIMPTRVATVTATCATQPW